MPVHTGPKEARAKAEGDWGFQVDLEGETTERTHTSRIVNYKLCHHKTKLVYSGTFKSTDT